MILEDFRGHSQEIGTEVLCVCELYPYMGSAFVCLLGVKIRSYLKLTRWLTRGFTR